MSTMQERANELDGTEAIAVAGMVLHDLPDHVPASAFDHPGRRALVAHWQREKRLALTDADLKAAAVAAGVTLDDIAEAVRDSEASEPLAHNPTRLREARAELLNRQVLRQAQAGVERVEADRNASATVKALAYQRLADAERRTSKSVQDAAAGDLGEVLDGVMAGLRNTHSRGWLGLRLPSFPALDGKLCGLRGLMLLGAGPGVGKTQLTLQLGLDALSEQGTGLVYLSLEMSKDELGLRLLAMASGLAYRRLRLGDQGLQPHDAGDSLTIVPGEGLKLNDADRQRLGKGLSQLNTLKPRIRLHGSADIGSMSADGGDPSRWYAPLASMVEDAKASMGVQRVLVVVDNLQAIAVEPPHGRPWASDMDRDRTVIEGLTRLQHDTGDAVLVVSEVTKGNFKDADTQAAILGTGRNAYRADAVMLLKRRETDSGEDAGDGRVDLVIDKGRDGMIRGKVALEWDLPDYTRLRESEGQRR